MPTENTISSYSMDLLPSFELAAQARVRIGSFGYESIVAKNWILFCGKNSPEIEVAQEEEKIRDIRHTKHYEELLLPPRNATAARRRGLKERRSSPRKTHGG